MYTVLLFYKYLDIDQPELVMAWQRSLCQSHGILGRILIAKEGINGTVAGTPKQIRAYKQAMKQVPGFSDIEYKRDMSETLPFKKLIVKVRDEVVTLGREADPKKGAKKLSPDAFHKMISEEDVVLLDARNNYESAIGRFKGAITPDIKLFKDFPEALKAHEGLKNKKVVTYCTGGIRCEKASALMLEQGFGNVYQLDGGIIKYAQKYPEGHWEGECYVFDDRIKVAFKDTPEKLGKCYRCGKPENQYVNCQNTKCNNHVVMCQDCTKSHNSTCSDQCRNLLAIHAA